MSQTTKANDTQIGGDHYKKGGEEHWDRAWRLNYDPFQYIITKWIERWRDKGGIEDLKKVRHAVNKYIELLEAGGDVRDPFVCLRCLMLKEECTCGSSPSYNPHGTQEEALGDATRDYVQQD